MYRARDLSAYVHSSLAQLRRIPEVTECRNLLVYVPLADEIPLLEPLQHTFIEKRWFVPLREEIAFCTLHGGTQWAPGEQKSAIIVPARAATRAGHRLGRGGGWYDRFLSRHGTHLYSVCVVPDFALYDTLPTEDHDVAVDTVVVATS